MPPVKQASKQKRTTKAAAVTMLGAAGLSLSLMGSASASTIPQSDNSSPNHRFVLGEEEMADVSLAAFHLFDRENVGSGVQLTYRGWRGCRGCRGCALRACGGCARGGCAASDPGRGWSQA